MGAKLITYECVAVDHRPDQSHADKLTIHQSAWAFCAFDARADGHTWKETGGQDIDALLRHAGLSAFVEQHRTAAHAKP